jgi:antitoxin VapB
MALSIRNEKAEQLAREVASETGESLTQAILRALEERLERLRGRKKAVDLVQEIMAISERCKALPDCDPRTPEDILGYGSNGVPE